MRRLLAGVATIMISAAIGAAAVNQGAHPPDRPWWDLHNWVTWFGRDPQNALLLILSAVGSGGGFALTAFQVWVSRASEDSEGRQMARIETLESSLVAQIQSVQNQQTSLKTAVASVPAETAQRLIEAFIARQTRTEREEREKSLAAYLPNCPPRFLGRDKDLQQISDCLTASDFSKSVIVYGGPGLGKSSLAVVAARDAGISQIFKERILFLQLEEVTATQQLCELAANRCGVDSVRPDDILGTILAKLGEEPLLLILDNLETLWEADSAACETQLSSLMQLKHLALLVTFRGAELPSAPDWNYRLHLQPLSKQDSAAIFLKIATTIAPNDRRLDELLAELGGVPLAIELVAQEASLFNGLEGVWSRWQEMGVALAKRRNAPPGRRTSLEYSIEMSMSSPHRGTEMLRALSAVAFLANGIDENVAKEILGKGFYEGQRNLSASGLGFAENGRINILPPVRRYVLQKMPIWEELAKDLVDAYLQLLGNALNDERKTAVLKSVVNVETPNYQKVLPLAVTRTSWKSFQNLVGDVLKLYQTNWREMIDYREVATHLRFLRSFSAPLEYIAYHAYKDRNASDMSLADMLALHAEQLIDEIMQWPLYNELTRMFDLLPTVPEGEREDAEAKLKQLKTIYDEYFGGHAPREVEKNWKDWEVLNAVLAVRGNWAAAELSRGTWRSALCLRHTYARQQV